MTIFNEIQSKLIDKFAEWLDEYEMEMFDGSPWMEWFNKMYCSKCDSIICRYEKSGKEFFCSWCELHDRCQFFPEMMEAPNNKQIIEMWLKSKTEGNK